MIRFRENGVVENPSFHRQRVNKLVREAVKVCEGDPAHVRVLEEMKPFLDLREHDLLALHREFALQVRGGAACKYITVKCTT